jgi:hypothetical protein
MGNTLLVIALVAAMAATAYVLVRGVIAMASGKDVTGEQQQNYMQKRVLFQGIAIVIVILILVLASGGR